MGLLPAIVFASNPTDDAVEIALGAPRDAAEAEAVDISDESGTAQQPVSQVKSLRPHGVPVLKTGAVLGPRKGGCNRCATEPECCCHYWDYRLDMNAATGRSSFGGDNEWQRYRFQQALHTPRGNEYEFWQQWETERNFIASRQWGIGAAQKIPNFWNDGTLRFSQEYRDYRDFDFADQRRRQTDIRLRLDPRWQEDRVRAMLDYRFRNVDYPNFTTESYVLHDARLWAEYDVNTELRASGGLRYNNYNYALGGTRSSNMLRQDARLDWRFNETTSAYLLGSSEDKNYNSRKDRNYDLNTVGAGFRWDPDSLSTLSGDVERQVYDRPFAPDRSYDEWSARTLYRRQLSCQVDMDLRYQWRDRKHDIDPLSDMRLNQGSLLLNYYPDQQWNFQGGWQRSDYDYANPLRASLSNVYTASAGYREGDSYAGFYWRRNATDFSGAPQFSNVRDDYDFEFSQTGCDWRWRSYLGFGRLNQDFPGTLNNFRERRLGCEWGYDLDCQTTLNLRYDYFLRQYTNALDFNDSRLEAGLTYKF